MGTPEPAATPPAATDRVDAAVYGAILALWSGNPIFVRLLDELLPTTTLLMARHAVYPPFVINITDDAGNIVETPTIYMRFA